MQFNSRAFIKFIALCSSSLLLMVTSLNTHARVVHQEKSLYRNILVEDTGDLRCLRFNVRSRKTNQSCYLKSQPKKLVFNYTKLMFSGLLLQPEPKNILIIGLGGGTMSNTLHELFPDSVIENIELDTAVIKVARQYFDFIENGKVSSIAKDGRVYVKRALLKKQKYDWIILDAFNGDYIPEHLLTKEFLQETKGLLSDGGILSSNTFSSSALFEYESATYQNVFGEFYSVKNRENENRVIVTSNQPLPTINELEARAVFWQERLNVYDVDIENVFKSIKFNEQSDQNTPILTDEFSPANLLNVDD